MSISELIKAMADAGAPMDAIVIAVEAIEMAQSVARQSRASRSSAAERQARYRERQKAKSDVGDDDNATRDVTGDVTGDASHGDTLPPASPPNDNISNPPHHPPSENPPVTPRKRRNGDKHPMPEGWWPDEFGPDTKAGLIVAAWNRDQFAHQFEKFKSHHTARGNKFADWQAAWKTWVLNSKEFGHGNRPAAPAGNSSDGLVVALRRRLDAHDAEEPAFGADGRAVRPSEGHRQGALALPSPDR